MQQRILNVMLFLAVFLQVILVSYAFWHLVIMPIFGPSDVKANFHYWLEVIYFTSGAILAATAVIALIYAWKQVEAAQESHKLAEHRQHTSVFLEIEGRWSSDGMLKSRREIANLIKKINPKNEDNKKFVRQFADEIALMRKYENKQYMQLMQFIFYIENLGLLVEQEYMKVDDVYSLLAPAIQTSSKVFRLYLLQRRRESEIAPQNRKALDLFGNALRLMRYTRLRARQTI